MSIRGDRLSVATDVVAKKQVKLQFGAEGETNRSTIARLLGNRARRAIAAGASLIVFIEQVAADQTKLPFVIGTAYAYATIRQGIGILIGTGSLRCTNVSS